MNSLPALLAVVLVVQLQACDAPRETGAEGTEDVEADTGEGSPPPDSGTLPLSGRHGHHLLVPLGETREAIIETVGEPDSVSLEAVTNRHVPGQTDTLVTLHYPGLRARIYQVIDGRQLLQEVRVTDDRFLRIDQLRIGMPWLEARRRFGDPDVVENGSYGYLCRECPGAREPVYLEVEDGRVKAVRFAFYVD